MGTVMDRRYIDSNHLVARYLAEQLAEDEREAFEAYYVEHPEMVRELEATARFKAGLAKLQASGELDRLMKPTPRFGRGYQLLAAGILIAAIGLSLVFSLTNAPRTVLTASANELTTKFGSSLPRGRTYTIMRLRGAQADAEIVLPASPRAIELRLTPDEGAEALRYDVTLSKLVAGQAPQEVARTADVPLGPTGHVVVYVNSGALTPGRYQLSISPPPSALGTVTSTRLVFEAVK